MHITDRVGAYLVISVRPVHQFDVFRSDLVDSVQQTHGIDGLAGRLVGYVHHVQNRQPRASTDRRRASF